MRRILFAFILILLVPSILWAPPNTGPITGGGSGTSATAGTNIAVNGSSVALSIKTNVDMAKYNLINAHAITTTVGGNIVNAHFGTTLGWGTGYRGFEIISHPSSADPANTLAAYFYVAESGVSGRGIIGLVAGDESDSSRNLYFDGSVNATTILADMGAWWDNTNRGRVRAWANASRGWIETEGDIFPLSSANSLGTSNSPYSHAYIGSVAIGGDVLDELVGQGLANVGGSLTVGTIADKGHWGVTDTSYFSGAGTYWAGKRDVAMTVTSMYCITDTGSVVVDVQEGSPTSFTGGADISASPMVCDPDEDQAATISNAVLDALDNIAVRIGTVTGSPNQLGISWFGTADR